MDIWAWVEDFTEQLAEDGHRRLAYEILHLPGLVLDNRHDEVDRLVPGLLAAARELNHRWLEVYIRHWNLQSRVLRRYEVKGLLPEAIDLLDFANQEDTKSCPQSICVVQDLANCYADTDGPGYGQERLDVAKETLSRIDPTWPCFRCISTEYAAALLDLGRPQEALDFCQQQSTAMGATSNPAEFRGSRVEALIALGRWDEALAFNTDAEYPAGGDSWVIHKTIDEARILARLGRHDEAADILPSFESIAETPAYFSDWTDATQRLVQAEKVDNTWELDLQLRVMALRLEDNGALREAWNIQRARAELSLDRGRPWVARHAVDAMRRVNEQFERPLDAPAQTDELDRKVTEAETAAHISVLDSPEANLEAQTEPDVDYARLRAALERWPDHEALWLGWSRTAGVLGRATEIIEAGRIFTERNPQAWQAAVAVGGTMVAKGQLEEAETWAEEIFARIDDVEARASARYIQAVAAEQRGDLETVHKRLHEVIELDPQARNSRSMLAKLARDNGDYELALEHLNVLAEVEPEAGPHHWDRIVAATLEDRWDIVRAAGSALGMQFTTDDGPIEEDWGMCRIQLRDETGTAFELHAVRTGPVTAHIVEISAPELPDQFFAAAVVFDPRPLNPPDPESPPPQEEDKPLVLTFPLLDILHASTYRAFAVDGARPSQVQFDALIADFRKMGGELQVRSGSDYEITHAELGSHPGAYWYVAVPEGAPLEAIAERLEGLDAALDGPLVWPELAQVLEQTDRLQAQMKDISEWSLM